MTNYAGTTYTGKQRIIASRALDILGNSAPTDNDALKEYGENGWDAGGDEISYLFRPDQITITDNGHGMIPEMLQDDWVRLEEALEMLERGEYVDWNKLKDSITPPSKSSFRWLMECVAFSGKDPSKDVKTRGMRAIGATAFRRLAASAEWVSLPNRELAEKYARAHLEGVLPDPIPTQRLRPATAEDLQRGRIDYSVETVEEPPTDPFGQVLESGTVFTMTRFRPGFIEDFDIQGFTEFLKRIFGAQIRSGALKVTIIDERVDNTRKIIPVPPASYRGTLAIKRTGYLRGGRGPFEIELYCDLNGRGARPMLRRRGSDVRLLTDLKEFKSSPWTSGKIDGYIEFPNIPEEEESLWDSAKTMPLANTPTRNQWKKEVWALVNEIEEYMQDLEEQAKDAKLQEHADILGRVASQALQQLPEFSGIVLQTSEEVPPTRGRPIAPSGPPRPPLQRVIARVINEHNKGVSDVVVELVSTTHAALLTRQTTGSGGRCSFGKLSSGKYTLRVVIPQGAESLDRRIRYDFEISKERPGMNAIFKIRTGEPAPPPPPHKQQKIQGVKPWYHAWGDLDQPYSIESLPVAGLVEINTEAPALRDAIDAKDEQRQLTIEALCMALAITEYASFDSQISLHDAHVKASLLFNAILTDGAVQLEQLRRQQQEAATKNTR